MIVKAKHQTIDDTDTQSAEQSVEKLQEEELGDKSIVNNGYPVIGEFNDLESGWYFRGVQTPEELRLEGEEELPRGRARELLLKVMRGSETGDDPNSAEADAERAQVARQALGKFVAALREKLKEQGESGGAS